MPITTYRNNLDPIIGKGHISRYAEAHADTFAAGGAIEWGTAIQPSASDANIAVRYDGTGPFAGVAIAQHYGEYRVADVSQNLPVGSYARYDAVSALRKGTITVQVLEAVTRGQSAVVDNATGNFRPSGSATTAVSGVVGTFRTGAAANGIAELIVNLP